MQSSPKSLQAHHFLVKSSEKYKFLIQVKLQSTSNLKTSTAHLYYNVQIQFACSGQLAGTQKPTVFDNHLGFFQVYVCLI